MTELMEGGLPVPACLHPHHQQMCNKSNHQGSAYTGNRTMMGNGVELRGPTAVGFSNKAVNSRHPLQILLRLLVCKFKFPVAFISLYELAIYTFKQAITNSQSLASKPFMNICLCCNSVVYSVHS